MVVKVKRKSINSSGVWEVDETALADDSKNTKQVTTPKPVKDKNTKQITTPKPVKDKSPKLGKGKQKSITTPKSKKVEQSITFKPENQETGSPRKSDSTPEKANQSFSPLKREGPRIYDDSTPAKQKKQNESGNQTDRDPFMEWDETSRPQAENNTFHSWTAGDLLNLVVRVEDNCQHLLSETYSTALEKVEWSKISFGDRSPKDCEEMWNILFKKARTNREIVEEIREYLVGKEIVTIEPPKSEEETKDSKFQEDVTASVENSVESEKSEENNDEDDDDNGDDDNDNEEEENEEGGADEQGEEEDDDNDDDDDGEEEEESDE